MAQSPSSGPTHHAAVTGEAAVALEASLSVGRVPVVSIIRLATFVAMTLCTILVSLGVRSVVALILIRICARTLRAVMLSSSATLKIPPHCIPARAHSA